jgi:hypothetical protein
MRSSATHGIPAARSDPSLTRAQKKPALSKSVGFAASRRPDQADAAFSAAPLGASGTTNNVLQRHGHICNYEMQYRK